MWAYIARSNHYLALIGFGARNNFLFNLKIRIMTQERKSEIANFAKKFYNEHKYEMELCFELPTPFYSTKSLDLPDNIYDSGIGCVIYDNSRSYGYMDIVGLSEEEFMFLIKEFSTINEKL